MSGAKDIEVPVKISGYVVLQPTGINEYEIKILEINIMYPDF